MGGLVLGLVRVERNWIGWVGLRADVGGGMVRAEWGVRRRPKTTASDWCSWRDRIVPFRMESITLDIEGPHFRVADLDALWIVAPIKLAPYCQTCPGRGRGYQFDHCFAAGQRLAAPSLGDVAEQAVLSSRSPCSTAFSEGS